MDYKKFCKEYPLTTPQLAQQVGVVSSRIRQQANDIEQAGLAKFAGFWRFKQAAVDFLKSKPETRGRTSGKERIRQMLAASGIKHPDVWKGYSAGTKKTGWHMREFGESQDIFLGENIKEAMYDQR